MNKTELIAAVAGKTELTKKDTEKVLKAFTDVVAEELKKKAKKYSWLDSEPLKYPREQQEKEEILRLAKL